MFYPTALPLLTLHVSFGHILSRPPQVIRDMAVHTMRKPEYREAILVLTCKTPGLLPGANVNQVAREIVWSASITTSTQMDEGGSVMLIFHLHLDTRVTSAKAWMEWNALLKSMSWGNGQIESVQIREDI